MQQFPGFLGILKVLIFLLLKIPHLFHKAISIIMAEPSRGDVWQSKDCRLPVFKKIDLRSV